MADKAYDAEWLHQYCKDRGIKACIPLRNYGEAKHHSMSLRRKSAKCFHKKRYGRREIAESLFSALKRKFGNSVSSVSAHTRRAELYCRAIAHNITSFVLPDFFNAAITKSKDL